MPYEEHVDGKINLFSFEKNELEKDSMRGRSKWLKKLGTSKGRLVWGSCSKREVLESNANWMEVRMLMAQLNMIQDTFGQCCSGVFTF